MRLAPAFAAALLAGCISNAGIAPTTTPAALRAEETDPHFTAWPTDTWWKAYGESELDALVDSALADHPSVQLARARLAQVQAGGEYLRANFAPRITAGYDGTWQRYSEHGLIPPEFGGSEELESRLGLDADLELDLFGRNRALVAALDAQAASGAANVASARLALATAICETWFDLAHALALREVASAQRRQREQIRRLVEARVAQGLDSQVELQQAEGAIHQIDGEIAALDEQTARHRQRLSRLAQIPYARVATLAPALHGVPAQAVPAQVPSDLLARRPDVAAALLHVESTLAGVDSVKAEFYPSVNLGAFIGLSSLGLSNLFDAGSRIYGLSPALRLPIFDAGRLRAKLKLASGEVDAAVADYNATLENALRDVVNALIGLRALDQRMAAQRAAQAAAESAESLALQRYRVGLTNYLTVLTTETEVLAQHRQAADLRARAMALNVELNFALGGGFDAATPSYRGSVR
ncbi:MAG TPA: efflux transporter outer membrane subunit [Gammaproteobacteria bacterium]|nr:efflux transporter outer membrane subunit [Gammaproteobacteria bacterium]